MRLNRRFLLCCTLAMLATGAPGNRALAQGTNGLLPSPISSRDLDLYGEALDLTSLQRQSIDVFHEKYREDFRVLREVEIERYMQQIGGMFGRGLRSMDRDAIAESIRNLDRLMGKIRLIDDRLFDGIQSVLTDEQAARLSRAMQARDRQRYRTGGSRMVGAVNRAARIDLARLHAGLELTEQERQTTEPFIIQYESRLSAATKALYTATTRMFLDVVESLEEQGVSVDDPGRMRDTMRTAFAEAIKKPRDKASELSDLNRRTLRQICELLETGSATRFRDRYLRRAYPEVPRTSASAAHRSYQAALSRRDLPESVRSDVRTAAALFRAGRVVVVEKMIDAIDEFRRTWSPMNSWRRGRRNRDGERTDRQEHEATLETFRQRLAAIDEAGLDALYALVDDDLAATIRSAVASGSFDSVDAGGAGMGGAANAAAAANGPRGAAAPGLGPNPYLPTPITRRDIASYRDRLELGDTDWYVLQSLHEEYVDNFDRVRQTDIAELRRAEAEPSTPQQIDTVYELRARALKSIRQVDAMLFDDIETLIATDEQQPDARRLRLARDRFVYNRGLGESSLGMIYGGRNRGGRGGRGSTDGGSLEAGVDVGRLVDVMDLSDQQRAETSSLLVEYETAASDGFRRQYESAMRLRRESEKLRARTQRQPGDGEQERRRQRNRWQAYRDLMNGDGRKAGEARQFMVDLNRATLSTIAEALPEDLAETLRDAYNRTAFPGIYDNPRAAGRYLVAALELTDLESRQRAGIESLHAEYAPEQRRIAEQMREFYSETSQVTGADRQQWRGFQQRRNRLEVLEFDRREINARAFRRLRDILTDNQQTRLRLPAEATPGADDDRTF